MNEPAFPTARQSAFRIFKNAQTLLSGKALAGLLSLAYLAIAGRALGPEGLGYLVLAHTYVLLIASIAGFKSWQAIVRFGAPMIADNEDDQFKTLTRFTTKLDLLSGAAAIAIAVGCVGFVSNIMNWPDEVTPLVYLYCFTAPFLVSATPTGILQLFDNFRALGFQYTILPGARFAGALLVWFVGGGLTGFLIVWIVSSLLHGFSIWYFGWRELKKRSLLPSLKKRPGDTASPQWLPFMIKINLSSTIELTHSNLPVLLVGGVLGSAASGLLQIAINVTNLIAHPTNVLNHATYPELSKVRTMQGEKQMRKLAFRSLIGGMATAAPFVAIYIIFGENLATAVAGPAFAAAGVLVGLMAVAQLLRVASVILQSAVLANGRAGFVLSAQVVSASIKIAILLSLLTWLGPVSAPIALMIGAALLIPAYIFALHQNYDSANLHKNANWKGAGQNDENLPEFKKQAPSP